MSDDAASILKRLRMRFRTNATRERKALQRIREWSPNRDREEYHAQTWDDAARLVEAELKKLE